MNRYRLAAWWHRFAQRYLCRHTDLDVVAQRQTKLLEPVTLRVIDVRCTTCRRVWVVTFPETVRMPMKGRH